MNSKQIIIGVGELLNKWHREEDSACTLYVEHGKICCVAKGLRWIEGPPCLNITQWQVRNGLTSAQWARIGTELFNLYTKELACQERQKP